MYQSFCKFVIYRIALSLYIFYFLHTMISLMPRTSKYAYDSPTYPELNLERSLKLLVTGLFNTANSPISYNGDFKTRFCDVVFSQNSLRHLSCWHSNHYFSLYMVAWFLNLILDLWSLWSLLLASIFDLATTFCGGLPLSLDSCVLLIPLSSKTGVQMFLFSLCQNIRLTEVLYWILSHPMKYPGAEVLRV